MPWVSEPATSKGEAFNMIVWGQLQLIQGVRSRSLRLLPPQKKPQQQYKMATAYAMEGSKELWEQTQIFIFHFLAFYIINFFFYGCMCVTQDHSRSHMNREHTQKGLMKRL